MVDVYARLSETGIRMEQDQVLPCNGAHVELPYLVVQQDCQVSGDDMGRIQIETTFWTVAMFTRQRELELEHRILMALAGVGKVDVQTIPDGKPYQTNFTFKSKKTLIRRINNA